MTVSARNPMFVFNAEVPLTAAGLQTIAHHLGGAPCQVWASLKCTDAGGEGGYALNEQVPFFFNSPGNPTQPFSFDATNCYLLIEGAGIGLPAKAGGSTFSLTTSKWSLLIGAHL
jgi:hypothetical protein